MKKAKVIAKAANFSAVDFGKFNELVGYEIPLAPEVVIKGKVFGGQSVDATGAEFSFQVFAPGTDNGFLHTHKCHEELYFFLKGQGEYQVDGQNIPVGEGTVVRVAPAGHRTVRNTGNEPLVMLCVQYRGNAFDDTDATDGVILNDKVEW
jgi:mannose-6-phosphate isomerase-like protein (cupin superfamily)